MHVFDLEKQGLPKTGALVVVFGKEPFLQELALRQVRESLAPNDQMNLIAMDQQASWADVLDELGSRSLFGGGRSSLVIVRPADPFVTSHRGDLEKYLEHPKSGVLVLAVESWPSNTRLAKRVAEAGLAIDCRPPTQERGSGLDKTKIVAWLQERATDAHGFKMGGAAARELLDLLDAHFGVLDQELAKLALFVSGKRAVSAELVREVVGGWKKQTVWELVDAVADGNTREALVQFNRLLQSGEAPQALFGQIAWGLRRYAAATNIFESAERRGEKIPLDQALQAAGFRWNLPRAKAQLLHIGRERAKRLHGWLLETDLALKGSHSQGGRSRAALEHLLMRIAAPA